MADDTWDNAGLVTSSCDARQDCCGILSESLCCDLSGDLSGDLSCELNNDECVCAMAAKVMMSISCVGGECLEVSVE